tara:strand:+ start:135243 stop:135452 length:210 start_codon:yes stop_codon:yes gene_type:complete
MSPLTLDRIKKAGGNVRITEEKISNTSVAVNEYQIKILEGGAWVTVFKSRERGICEQAVRGVNSRLLLG